MAGLYETSPIPRLQHVAFDAPVEKIAAVQGKALVLSGVTHTLISEGESTTVNAASVLVAAANNATCSIGVTFQTGY